MNRVIPCCSFAASQLPGVLHRERVFSMAQGNDPDKSCARPVFRQLWAVGEPKNPPSPRVPSVPACADQREVMAPPENNT